MQESYVIYGAGGHAKVIVDLILILGGKIECVFDDNIKEEDVTFMNIQVLKYNSDLFSDSKLIIAIGDNFVRNKISLKLSHDFATLIHPSASVSELASIGKGSVVLSNAVIQAEVTIGEHSIVNVGACIDHEAIVSNFVHIAPMVYVGSSSVIQNGVKINPGAIISRNSEISEN